VALGQGGESVGNCGGFGEEVAEGGVEMIERLLGGVVRAALEDGHAPELDGVVGGPGVLVKERCALVWGTEGQGSRESHV